MCFRNSKKRLRNLYLVSLMEQPAGLGKKILAVFQSQTLVIRFGWRRAGAGGG